MAKRTPFTKEERTLMTQHPCVVRYNDQSITYAPEFKQRALHAYFKEGKDARTIFAEAHFPPTIVASELPRWLLKDWRKAAGALEEKYDFRDRRGQMGRPKSSLNVSKMTPQERIEYLEARVAYVDAENDFLARARGIKRAPFDYRQGKDSR